MPKVSTSTVLCNLRAVSAFLAVYPSQTVLMALDRMGASSAGIPADLLDLSGSEACEAIEAEITVRSSGWKVAA